MSFNNHTFIEVLHRLRSRVDEIYSKVVTCNCQKVDPCSLYRDIYAYARASNGTWSKYAEGFEHTMDAT